MPSTSRSSPLSSFCRTVTTSPLLADAEEEGELRCVHTRPPIETTVSAASAAANQLSAKPAAISVDRPKPGDNASSDRVKTLLVMLHKPRRNSALRSRYRHRVPKLKRFPRRPRGLGGCVLRHA